MMYIFWFKQDLIYKIKRFFYFIYIISVEKYILLLDNNGGKETNFPCRIASYYL